MSKKSIKIIYSCVLSLYFIHGYAQAADNNAAEVITLVRQHYAAQHIVESSKEGIVWEVGILNVPHDTYISMPNHVEFTYSWKVDDKKQVISEHLKFATNSLPVGNEWMRNPVYTAGFNARVAGNVAANGAQAFNFVILPFAQVTKSDVELISLNPRGFEALESNLNACLDDSYGKAMVGWLGIRDADLTGAVIYSLLQRTKPEYRPSVAAILVGKHSKFTIEKYETLADIVLSEDNSKLAVDLTTGTLATMFCSVYEADSVSVNATRILAKKFKLKFTDDLVFKYINSQIKP